MKLVKFLMKLANETVHVETKNDTKVHGTIVGVDMQMNIHLKNVKITYRSKQPVSMQFLTLRGHSIRCVVLPESIPLDTLLNDEAPKRAKTGAAARGRGRGRGRGVAVKKR